jgi:FG-GAP-like repeat/Ig-like domain CHU_C associated
MKHRLALAVAVLALSSSSVLAATFIVPTDEEMVTKSRAIAIGVVEGSFVQDANGTIETTYEIRVERAIKGSLATEELLRVTTHGGVLENRGVLVPGEAEFEQGERVLLFLTRDDHGRWRTTDMTLGKFRFVTSTKGERMLVRDLEDVLAWDRAGRDHQEKVRREEGFLRFVTERARGRSASSDYMVSAAEVTLATDEPSGGKITTHAPTYPPPTYTAWVAGRPVRWPTMANGVRFYKRSGQNIAGASDGGVSVIQNGLAAWTNECGSLINLIYGGQVAVASANHDGTNVVEYNDPQQRIGGSWGGSGTIGYTFISFAGDPHPFAGTLWLNITDADVIFQDGFPATHAAFAPAMTHEIGHAIGWRHSNQNHQTGGACNPAVEECTTAAIMNSTVSGNWGYTLQAWDMNAAQAVYPGGTCGVPTCTPPSITAQPQGTTITAGSSATLSVGAAGTAPLSYQWFMNGAPGSGTAIAGATGPTLTVSPTTTTTYWVSVTNSCGTINSNAAAVTVTAPPTVAMPPRFDLNGDGLTDIFWQHNNGATAVWLMNITSKWASTLSETTPVDWRATAVGDFNGDGRGDVFLRHTNGSNSIWFMNGTTKASGSYTESAPPNWRVAAVHDFSGDGRADIFWRDPATGQNAIWLMNGATKTTGVVLESADQGWSVGGSGDFNGDGRADILWRHTNGQNAIWLMNGAAKQAGAVIEAIPDTGWQVGAVGDFNGDNRADIFWRHSTGANSLWTMNGFTKVSGVWLESASTNWRLEQAGDLDGDRDADLIWRDNSSGSNSIWIMEAGNKSMGAYVESAPVGWRIVAGK